MIKIMINGREWRKIQTETRYFRDKKLTACIKKPNMFVCVCV